MTAFMIVPFLALVVIAYAALVLLGDGLMAARLAEEMFRLGNLPGQETGADGLPVPIVVTLGDLFVASGLVLLGLELMKSASTHGGSLVNHGLSTLALVGAVALFVVVPGFSTTTFLLLTVMVLIDVLVGFTLTALAARRDVSFDR
jgi:hypothetical protein